MLYCTSLQMSAYILSFVFNTQLIVEAERFVSYKYSENYKALYFQ